MTQYLTVAEVIVIHDEIMQRTGYAPEGLRDEGLLESALMRAQAAAHYEGADLIRQAVLMAVGISQNQPFADGNKRAAFGALDVFLRINGMYFSGDSIELAKQFESLADPGRDRGVATGELVEWLRARTSRH
ncbi:MAG: type II toxin-antitoxin system death-on-curing family toxin [Thermomicrobiales bacterium]